MFGLFDAHQIFPSLQVKRNAIISNKQGVYELPSNDLSLRKIRKNQENLKTC